MKNYNMILTENQQKYQDYHLEKLINMNILQVKKYYLLIKEELQNKLSWHILLFEKQTKTIEEQGKKQIDAITNQNKGLETLTNKDDHKIIYKEIFDKIKGIKGTKEWNKRINL